MPECVSYNLGVNIIRMAYYHSGFAISAVYCVDTVCVVCALCTRYAKMCSMQQINNFRVISPMHLLSKGMDEPEVLAVISFFDSLFV